MSDLKAIYNEKVHAHPDDLCKQVVKTVNGQSVDTGLLQVMAEQVIHALRLNKQDSVLDLCCGNGLITQRVASCARQLLAVDFSEAMIAVAKAVNAANNVDYQVSDVTRLEHLDLNEINKCYMYDALSHFAPPTLTHMLAHLQSQQVKQVLFASVPDRDNIWRYYDTDAKRDYYWQCERMQQPHMGRWWLKRELQDIGKELGYRVSFLEEPSQLPTAYYRFNCLMDVLA